MKNLLPVILVIAALFICLGLDMHLHDGEATLLSYIPAGVVALFVLAVVARSVYNWAKPLIPRLEAFLRTRAGFWLKLLLSIAVLCLAVLLVASCQSVPQRRFAQAVVFPAPEMVTDSAGWTGPKRVDQK